MKYLLTLFLVLTAFCFTGCSEETTPTQVTTLEKTGPPMEAGIVYRGTSAVGLTWVDVEAGLRVIVGADMSEFCDGIINFDPLDFQDVNLPGGRLVTNTSATTQTTVWDFLEFDCALFTSMDPVASGESSLRGVDNDVAGSVISNTNTWGWSAQGKLLDGDGNTVRFNGFIRQQFGNDSGPKVVTQINLH